MPELRQAVLGIVAALISSGFVIGALTLSLAERDLDVARAWRRNPGAVYPSPVIFVDTPAPGEPTFTPSPSPEPSLTPGPPSETPNCLYPLGWTAITVQPGDTLDSLAQAYNTSVDALHSGNCLPVDLLMPGMSLFVPPLPTATATLPPTETLAPRHRHGAYLRPPPSAARLHGPMGRHPGKTGPADRRQRQPAQESQLPEVRPDQRRAAALGAPPAAGDRHPLPDAHTDPDAAAHRDRPTADLTTTDAAAAPDGCPTHHCAADSHPADFGAIHPSRRPRSPQKSGPNNRRTPTDRCANGGNDDRDPVSTTEAPADRAATPTRRPRPIFAHSVGITPTGIIRVTYSAFSIHSEAL
jgi:LysM repeat protein